MERIDIVEMVTDIVSQSQRRKYGADMSDLVDKYENRFCKQPKEGMSMENRELLPCPFCAGIACVGEVDGTFFVCCSTCHVELYPYTILDSYGARNSWTKEEAINEWNTRQHPSGGLVSLDEEKLTDFLVAEGGEQGHKSYWGYKARSICSRFGQPSVKLPPRKEHTVNCMIKCENEFCSCGANQHNRILDDISKLNSTEG